jgi:hypothetical protein
MSSLLFSSFQGNTKCESSFFADTCTLWVPIFFLRGQRNGSNLIRHAGAREVATRAMIFSSGKTSAKPEFYKSRLKSCFLIKFSALNFRHKFKSLITENIMLKTLNVFKRV